MKKKPTFTLRSSGETLLTSQFENVCRRAAVEFFNDIKTVSLIDNQRRETIARWNYGYPQEVRTRK